MFTDWDFDATLQAYSTAGDPGEALDAAAKAGHGIVTLAPGDTINLFEN